MTWFKLCLLLGTTAWILTLIPFRKSKAVTEIQAHIVGTLLVLSFVVFIVSLVIFMYENLP
jgi:heme/copper-type cytochrome/quinol oxidase subunit 4